MIIFILGQSSIARLVHTSLLFGLHHYEGRLEAGLQTVNIALHSTREVTLGHQDISFEERVRIMARV